MSDYPVTCSKGHRLQNENEAPCPICGDTRRVTHKELRLQSTSSVRVGVTIHRFQTEAKKNWPLIAVLIACTLLPQFPTLFPTLFPAFLNGRVTSVVVALLFSALSGVIGYYAITRVITITKETR
jgi:hypothetical protein